MPKITYLKTFEGALWARLELDHDPRIDGVVHVFTDKEIIELKAAERKAVWDELNSVANKYDYDDNEDY